MEQNNESSLIEELRAIEQNLQHISSQKQSNQIDLNEVNNALEELNKTSDEVFKIVSGLMLKIEKSDALKDLDEKRKLLEMRISSIEKQEKLLEKKAEELKTELTQSASKHQNNHDKE